MEKSTIILILVIIFLIAGIFYFMQPSNVNQNNPNNNEPGTNGQNQNQSGYDIQGMKVEILKEGTGEGAKAGDNVLVDYVGTMENGTKFDSSLDRGQPLPLTLGQNSVIKGWELGLLGMKIGEKRRLTIPPELAYGSRGAGNIIPPDATLIFEVEMRAINS